MINEKRNETEIELDVLKAIYYGEHIKTNIARHANLPTQKFDEIINNLSNDRYVDIKENLGYIKDKRIKNIYKLTKDGEIYLFDGLIKLNKGNKCPRHKATKLIQNNICLNCGKRYVK